MTSTTTTNYKEYSIETIESSQQRYHVRIQRTDGKKMLIFHEEVDSYSFTTSNEESSSTDDALKQAIMLIDFVVLPPFFGGPGPAQLNYWGWNWSKDS